MKDILTRNTSNHFLLKMIILLIGGFSWMSSDGQASMNNIGVAVIENFTGYMGTSTLPTNWTVTGTGNWAGSNQTTGATGGWYGNNNMSYLGSGSASNGNATWKLQNNTGSTITSFDLSFLGTMFKNGSTSPTVSVTYLISSSATVPAPGSLTSTGLSFNDGTPSIGAGVNFNTTITGITINAGEYLYIRFVHPGGSNSDNLGWDNVSVTPYGTICTAVTPTGSILGTTPACGSTALTISSSAPGGETYYWQTSATGTSTANSGSSYTATTSGTYYVRSYNGTCWSSATSGYDVIIANNPTITTQPANQTATIASSATFAVVGTNIGTVQWQENTGSGWNNITNGGVYSGATTSSLTITNPPLSMTGYQYRAILSNSPCTSVTSNAAILTVNDVPVSLWSNPITGLNPSSNNPYTIGNIVNSNISINAMAFVGVTAAGANDRFNTTSWPNAINVDKYFSFGLTPNSGYSIDFTKFDFTWQSSGTGPQNYAVRSSVDGFASDIATGTNTSVSINLSAAAFQNIQSTIEFRVYCFNASSTGGTASINDFNFYGYVKATTPCAEPTKQPTNLNLSTLSSLTQTSISGSFTAPTPASAVPTNYLVLISTSSTLTAFPADATTYPIGSTLGNATVVDNDGNTSFTANGLEPGTDYYFFIYSFNKGTSCSPNYFLTNPLTGIETTRPNLPTNLTVSCQTGNSATLNWNLPDGSYDGIIILARQGTNPPSLPESTLDPNMVAASSIFGTSTAQVSGTGPTYAVYKGLIPSPGTTVTVTGLTSGQPYRFLAVAYKSNRYSSTTSPSASIASLGVQDVNNLSAAAQTGSANLIWTNPSSGCFDEVLVVANLGGVTFTPTGDGSAYTANSIYSGPNQVVYKGTGNDVNVTGLTDLQTYCFKVFVRSGTNWSQGVEKCIVINAGTVFNPGELFFTAIDSKVGGGSNDEYLVASLVPITPGTKFSIVNSRYEGGAAAGVRTNRWGGPGNDVSVSPSIIEVTYNNSQVIPAGSIIKIISSGINSSYVDFAYSSTTTYPGSYFTVEKPEIASGVPNISSADPDQVYIMQGEFSLDGSITGLTKARFIFNGRVLFGVTIGADWVPLANANSGGTASSNRTSRKPFEIECFNYVNTSIINYMFYKNSSLHTGTIRTILKNVKDFNTNWVTSLTGTGLEDFVVDANSTDPNEAGRTFDITTGPNTNGTWIGDKDQNWFDCNNWEGLAVPDSITDVYVKADVVTASRNIPQISNTATFAPEFQKIAKARDLNISFQGVSMILNNLDTLKIFRNLNMSAGTLSLNSGTVTIAGVWNRTGGTFNYNTGTVLYNGLNQDIANETYYHLKLGKGGTKTAPTTTLNIKGDFIGLNSAVFAHNNGTVEFNGSGNAQNYAATNPFIFYNLTNKNTTNLNFNSDLSLIRSLDLQANSKSNLGDGISFSLKSNATSTANVLPVGAGANISYAGSGRFFVERFLGIHQRKWQFLAWPVQNETNGTIRNSWQENGTADPFYGTWIGSNLANGSNGFDVASIPTNGANVKWYVPGTGTTDYWDESLNSTLVITQTNAHNSQGYMVYLRGNRNATPANSVTSNVTLRTKGKLNILAFTAPNVPAGMSQSIGNPYASALDMSKVLAATANPGVQNGYTLWDPKIPGMWGLGAYVSFSGSTATPWQPTQFIYDPSVGFYTSPNKYVVSGQAFFVSNPNATASSFSFAEDQKSTDIPSQNQVYLRGGNQQPTQENIVGRGQIQTQMYYSNGTPVDGNIVVFSDEFSDAIDRDDLNKTMYNRGDFSLTRHGQPLVVEARERLNENDTVYYHLGQPKNGNYVLKFIPTQMDGYGLTGIFVDQYRNTRTNVSLSDTTLIPIYFIDSIASKASDRFYMIFKESVILPVRFVSITGNKNADGRTNHIQWKIADEHGILNYELQRSVNGIDFTPLIQNIASTGTNIYDKDDVQPLSNDNFYRVKAYDQNGAFYYSATVKIGADKGIGTIAVFPNPVLGSEISVQFTGIKSGKYKVQLTNKLGQVVLVKDVIVSGNQKINIKLDKKLASGTYQLKIVDENATVVKVEQLLKK